MDKYTVPARSGEELSTLRAEALRRDGPTYGFSSYTCDQCPCAPTCAFAFDAYNTDGDCLMEK